MRQHYIGLRVNKPCRGEAEYDDDVLVIRGILRVLKVFLINSAVLRLSKAFLRP